jgi:8-oxo-dGTP pyrophosphatase MutT (NUDIX family)
MSGRLPYEAALREAWEEAGAEGRIDADPTGEFPYRKMLKSGSDLPVRVEVFPLLVERLAADYPERRQRRRRWFDPAKAARKVAEPGLGAIILQFCMMVERSRAAEAARVAPVTIAG